MQWSPSTKSSVTPSGPDPTAARGGGALRDINVYNLHYTAELFGVPEKTQYYPNTGFNGVDISGTMVLEYEGFTAGKVHHRMTREFMDFAQIIDQKDAAQADRYASETLGVMKILSES